MEEMHKALGGSAREFHTLSGVPLSQNHHLFTNQKCPNPLLLGFMEAPLLGHD